MPVVQPPVGRKGHHEDDGGNADPHCPVETPGTVDAHGGMPLRIDPAVERLVGGEVLEFQHTDPLDCQHAVLLRARQPAVVDILCLRRDLLPARLRPFGRCRIPEHPGDLVDERHAPLLRREDHLTRGRLDQTGREAPGPPEADAERPHAGQVQLPARRQQVARQAVHLIDHRILCHCFFLLFLGCTAVGCAAGLTAAGTTSGREKPR